MISKKSRIIRLLALFFSLTILLSGCGDKTDPDATTQVASTEPTSSETPAGPMAESGGTVEAQAIANAGAYTTVYEYAPEDMSAEWNTGNATTVVFDGGGAQISGNGASFSGKVLTIRQAGTYVLSGTMPDGQVLIDAGKQDVVRLVLGGISLHNETGPAIYAPQSKKVVLILEKGTENTVADAVGYFSEGSDDPDAAIFIQDDLSITGEGTLNVTGAMKHGIRTQDILAITGGVIRVDAEGDALRGRDGVAIQNGTLTLNAKGDGIQSNNDEDDVKGFVTISGGMFVIEAGNDGIQAQSALTVTGGSFIIKTGGGSANAPVREEDFRGGRGTPWGTDQSTESGAAEEESVSMKALKAGKHLTVAGGEFIIDAEDDAAHSNGTLLITSGKFSIQTGDDGFHADAALEISGGETDILTCYEGIEGLSVTVSGGTTSITANDDAINAAGGADGAAQAFGPMGRDTFAANGDIFVRITGGTLDLYAIYDGIDSNGNIFLEGGFVKISGPSQGTDGAIDLDGAMTVTGGELITAGSVLSVSQDSTQPVILVSYTGQLASGSLIEFKNALGETLLTYKSKTACTLSGFTSPSFSVGETYALFIDGEKRVEVNPDGILTSIADDGSAYNGNMGGMGGGRGNWGDGTPPEGRMPQGGGRGNREEGAPAEGGMPPGGGTRPSNWS